MIPFLCQGEGRLVETATVSQSFPGDHGEDGKPPLVRGQWDFAGMTKFVLVGKLVQGI